MAVENRCSIEEKIKTLEASRDTLTYQIKNLDRFYNYLQVRMWRKKRTKIKRLLLYYKERLKIYPK